MVHRLQLATLVLALCVPFALPAQLVRTPSDSGVRPRRAGSWEVSLGGGVLMLDHGIRDFLQSGQLGASLALDPALRTGSRAPALVLAAPGAVSQATVRVFPGGSDNVRLILPTTELRVGYNIDDHLGISINAAQATGGGVTSLFIGPAVTWTMNLDRSTRPFVLAGSDYQRISGANGGSIDANWGAHVGIGMRQMLTARTALRIEARFRMSAFDELATHGGITYSPALVLGFSHFAGGARGAP